ncbi:hypothetical protein DXG01_000174 [Tephrocybe rancida]|nr:hypothetical protein DXG01_000174 [Tephrocybe rancida]
MAEREARIRRYEGKDETLVRFTIGKASMESLAVANRRAYIHPITLAAWLLMSYAIISYMNLWPADHYGIVGYLKPLPMLAASAVPIMFFIDWLNRPVFENATQAILRGPDMSHLLAHYSRHPASGLWIVEFGGLFVGLIGLDATSESALSKDGKKQSKGSSTSAIIRHFYVDEVYRSSGIQEDLLAHALRMAFNAEPALEVVTASDSSLFPYIRDCLSGADFASEKTQKVGVLGWQLGRRSLSREQWEKKTK